MAKSTTKSRREKREAQLLQDKNAAQRLEALVKFFQTEVLHGFLPITWVKAFLLLILLVLGYSVSRSSVLAGFCKATVREKKKLFQQDRLAELFHRKTGNGRKGKMNSVQDEIIEELESKDFRTVKQILKMISEKIHNTVSLTAVKNFLHKLGYKWLKCGSLPSKADPELQRKFYEETLKPLMDQAKAGTVNLLFVDASHFVMGNLHLGYIWCRVRRFIETFSGRTRYNVLAALNFVTKKMTTVTNVTYITATEVVELLEKLGKECSGPIYVVLDNAKYQKCKLVQEKAKELGIILVYLPPYSPNLNLIERFWKFVKKELSLSFFEVFSDYCKNIDLICQSTHTELKTEMDSLIGEEVQLFDGMVEKSSTSGELPRKAA